MKVGAGMLKVNGGGAGIASSKWTQSVEYMRALLVPGAEPELRGGGLWGSRAANGGREAAELGAGGTGTLKVGIGGRLKEKGGREEALKVGAAAHTTVLRIGK